MCVSADKHDLLLLICAFTMADCHLHSVSEHLLEGTPADWRGLGYVRVWPVTPIDARCDD